MSNGLRTTVAGSWWPSTDHEDDLRAYHHGQLSEEDGEELLKRAAAQAISEQRELGLDEWTGGEYFAYEFVEHLQRYVTGLAIEVPTKEEVFDYDDLAVARVEGELAAPNGIGYVQAYLRERDLPGGVPKATVVGPVEVAINLIGELDVIKGQMEYLTPIVNAELRGLAEAGCPHVQLDVPAFTTLITHGAVTGEEAAEIIKACFEGVEGCTRGLHTCSGNLRGRPLAGNLTVEPYVEMLTRLDGVIDTTHLALQYFHRFMEREQLKQLPQSMEVAVGIVDEASYWVEPVDKIRERTSAWAEVIGAERMWLAPSCGFGRHPARNVPVLRQKLENLVEAALSF